MACHMIGVFMHQSSDPMRAYQLIVGIIPPSNTADETANANRNGNTNRFRIDIPRACPVLSKLNGNKEVKSVKAVDSADR